MGRDLESREDCQAIKDFESLKAVEWANHSFNHEPWLHTYTRRELTEELERTEDGILRLSGQMPMGFRGPGFSCPVNLLELLSSRGYCYDSSLFPTSMAPLARAYFLMKTGRAKDDRMSQLYGGWRSVLRPNRIHQKPVGDTSLYEVPVSVLPIARTPTHFSYLTFLAQINRIAANLYWRMTLRLWRMAGTAPCLLLHPPDFLGGNEEQRLKHMPGMRLDGDSKRQLIARWLKMYADVFEVKTIAQQIGVMRRENVLGDSQGGSRPASLIVEEVSR